MAPQERSKRGDGHDYIQSQEYALSYQEWLVAQEKQQAKAQEEISAEPVHPAALRQNESVENYVTQLVQAGLNLPKRSNWIERAACRGTSMYPFFPPLRGLNSKGEPVYTELIENKIARVAQAKEICNGCAAREDCLEYAQQNKIPNGIWGGLTEDERKALRKRRK